MERFYGVVFFGLGVCILWQGRDLSIGSLHNPGSGLFPALIAVIMLVLSKTGFEPAPFCFALIIGPIMEMNFRQSLLQSRGGFGIFLARPISATLMGVSLCLLLIQLLPKIAKKRAIIASDDNV